MKIIKFCIICVIATMASLCVISCSKEYSSPLKGQVVKDLTFESSQSSNTVTIADADISGFTIKSSELWCTASAKGKVLTVTVQSNDTYDDRQATVTITDPEDQTSISFKVFQKQNDAILIDGSTFVVPEEGGDINIKIQSNVSYEVEIPATAPWLTKSTKAMTRGLVSSTIVLTAERNNSGEEREALVTFIDKESGVSSKITIKQSLTPYIEIEENQITLSEDEKEIEIVVKTNINLETVISNDWITDNGRESNGDFNFTQKLKVSKNNSGDEREAIVTFEDKKNGLTSEITIKQSLTPFIEIDKDQISLSENEKNIEIVVRTNINLETVITDDWIADIGRDSNSDLSFTQKLKVSAFSGGLSRSAVVTFKSQNNNLDLVKKVTITQTKEVKFVAKEVDLGLSVLWSEYNLGAENPENVGACFAWGEISQKNNYNQNNYLYYDNNMQQYIFIGNDISGTQYDAATANLGGKWRMPTRDEMTELLQNCSWTWMQVNGMNGFKVTGNNGNSIFMPAAGGAGYNQDGKYLRYYTSTQYSLGYVLTLVLDSSFFGSADFGFNQYNGLAIRPVKSK